MAGAEKLKEKILDEAKSDAEKSIRNSREEAEKILAEAKKEAKSIEISIIEKAKKDADEKKSRLIAAAKMEARKMTLKAKQDMIDEAFEKALVKLSNLPQKDYVNILADIITDIANKGEYELIVSDSDKAKIGMELTNKVNAALVSKNVSAVVKLSSVSSPIKSGFILKQGDLEVNNSFDVVLKAQREVLEADVVKALFKGI